MPEKIYRNNIADFEREITEWKRKKSAIGWARLVVMVAGSALTWNLFGNYGWLALLIFLVSFGVFLKLVSVSVDIQRKIRLLEFLADINREELKILDHVYQHRENGDAFLPKEHTYAFDLDVFGYASLFQYLNRCQTEQGKKLLAEWLLAPGTETSILQRQEAIRELALSASWGQSLQAKGMIAPVTRSTESKINHFLQAESSSFTGNAWKTIRYAGPVIMCSVLIAHIIGELSASWFYLFVFAAFLFTGWISKKAMPLYLNLNKVSPEMESFTELLKHVEEAPFKAPLLVSLQSELKTEGHSASSAIRTFRGILDRMDLRLNPLVFIPLNIFLFWDLQQLFALEKWKKNHQTSATRWLQSIAGMEALQSLATLHFNHPDWAFPDFSPVHGVFEGTSIGHPLIPASKRVCSDFSTSGTPRISLITGSNMAGKSTFLRSIGINTILAMAGGPVCCKSLTLSNMRVMSSMRIADNLEESTSTFYAELKKLKVIITAVKNKENVFVLLDEILRGTNSHDRHTGSAALINQFIRENAVALIATHDLELAGKKNREDSASAITNYHFDVQVQGEELYFDYKLKPGICKSMNASLLMKKIGIEV